MSNVPADAPRRFDRKAYMREYQRKWVAERRRQWISENGPCAICGSLDNLEVDHIDRATKELRPTDIWSRRKEVRDKELAKCQVLCEACHTAKSVREGQEDGFGFRSGRDPGNRALDAETVAAIRKLIRTGLSAGKIAKRIGCTVIVVKEIREGRKYKQFY